MAKRIIHPPIEPGQRFTRLIVLTKAEPGVRPDGRRYTRWLCRCDCGAEKTIAHASLRTGNTQSCGCLNIEQRYYNNRKHGKATSRLYRLWASMKQRCFNKNSYQYPSYGGRGITVCDRWRDSFENFSIDVGFRPPGYTLERIDNNGNYEPGNVKWATRFEQSRNRRDNVIIEWQGKQMTITDAAQIAGLSVGALKNRLARGWSIEAALTTPPDPRYQRSS